MATSMNRRKFLTAAGIGTAAVAASAGIAAGTGLFSGRGNTFAFKALVGLPAAPLPNYCTLVLEGHIDLAAKSGTVTQTMYAGYPEAVSNEVWSGFSRLVRVGDVRQSGNLLRISGTVADRSQLRSGESAEFALSIDRGAKKAQGSFMGHAISLTLA